MRLKGGDYVDSEEQLHRNLHGTQPLFGDVLPQEEDVRAGVVQIKGVGKFGDPKFLETVELNKRANTEPKLKFLNNASAHLSSYLRGRALHSLMGGGGDVGEIINASLESSSTLGLPPLRGGTVIRLNNRNMAGRNTVTKTMAAQALFGFPRLVSGLAVNPVRIGDAEWLVADFGDTIPLIGNDLFSIFMARSYTGGKCFVIHLAASLLALKSGHFGCGWNNRN